MRTVVVDQSQPFGMGPRLFGGVQPSGQPGISGGTVSLELSASITPTGAGAIAGPAGIVPTLLLRMYKLNELVSAGSGTFSSFDFGLVAEGFGLGALLFTFECGEELPGVVLGTTGSFVTASGGGETGAV